MRLELRAVGKTFTGNNGRLTALEGIDFEVKSGEFVCLLGPSGCGKSTLLNLIAGLEHPTTGEVLIDGKAVQGPSTDRVLLFQDAVLFPWLDVRDNVEFGLRMAGVPKQERRAIARRYLEMVHLSDFEHAYVHQLSGGMKQRVALARALATEPDVLLMDEPFGALDAQTRDLLHTELQAIWADTGKTVVFVTHNVREAIVLGDRVVVLSARPSCIRCEYSLTQPRPRQIESYAVVDLSREILAQMKDGTIGGTRVDQSHTGRVGETYQGRLAATKEQPLVAC